MMHTTITAVIDRSGVVISRVTQGYSVWVPVALASSLIGPIMSDNRRYFITVNIVSIEKVCLWWQGW